MKIVFYTAFGLLFFVCINTNTIAQQPKLMLPIGHTYYVDHISFSSDNKTVYTSSGNGITKLWELSSGKQILELNHHGNVSCAAVSADDNTIITCGYYSPIKIWKTNGELLTTIQQETGLVYDIKISPDNKIFATACSDSMMRIWDIGSGKLLRTFKGHTAGVWSVNFSPDGKSIVSAGGDRKVIVWDINTGKILFEKQTLGLYMARFNPSGETIIAGSYNKAITWNIKTGDSLILDKHTDWVTYQEFSNDGKKIATVSLDGNAILWDAHTGKQLFEFAAAKQKFNICRFTADSKSLIVATEDNSAALYNSETGVRVYDFKKLYYPARTVGFSSDGQLVALPNGRSSEIFKIDNGNPYMQLRGHTQYTSKSIFTNDNKQLISLSYDGTIKIWDALSGSMLKVLKGHEHFVRSGALSKDGKTLVSGSENGIVMLWNLTSLQQLYKIKASNSWIQSVAINNDGSRFLTGAFDGYAKLWDGNSGKLLYSVKAESDSVSCVKFSNDQKKFIVTSFGKQVRVYNTSNGELAYALNGHNGSVENGEFTPDDKYIITCGRDSLAIIWDAASGQKIHTLKGHNATIETMAITSDSRFLATASYDKKAKLWDFGTGKLIKDFNGHTDALKCIMFTPDNKYLFTGALDNTGRLWEVSTGKMKFEFTGHTHWLANAGTSSDGKRLVTNSDDNTSKLWDLKTGELLYTFFAVDTTEYIVTDTYNRYDGSAAARKLLYFTCGKEIIELEQLKDKLWVPDLAERINKGERINAPTLSELNVCGLTPLVEPLKTGSGYNYKITPRTGGLGETIVFINGIETKKIRSDELLKVPGGFELHITAADAEQYFVAGKSNEVYVKSYTSENDIASRGIVRSEFKKEEQLVVPNLYAVVIGVSDYKGEGLDLKYAAKDATDIGNAISLTASKMLGKEHVKVYNLNTSKDRLMLPEKKAIRDVFTEIGRVAKVNDILVVFFAGHGVVLGENKQFYFLTADATPSAITATGINDVGISAKELTEWMKPSNIRAQKRILILDACNSGQAINQIVSVGDKNQNYLAARNDDKTQEVKEIDKLNERAGLYILAASASGQSAYELGRFSQGVLTYALLKSIKEHPEILEKNKYLNVSGWLNTSASLTSDIVRENKLRQEPQLITTTNFNIGIVDNDVLSKIILPNAKPLFTPVNFQNNDPLVLDDDLKLTTLMNENLSAISARSTDGKIVFTSSNSSEAWTLTGRYDIAGNEVTVHVNMKNNDIVKHRFKLTGKKSEMAALAESIINTAVGKIEKTQ